MTDFKIYRLVNNVLLIKFTEEPSHTFLHKLLALKEVLSTQFRIQVVHTYNELLLKSDSRLYISDIEKVIESHLEMLNDIVIQKRIFQLPVCYDTIFGIDLSYVAQEKNLSEAAVIDIHTSPQYLIYFLGFLPGFPYLEGLDRRLHIPRRDQPRKVVAQGSVGVGGAQTGIYPQKSPGGWQLIGNCPVPLFDVKNEKPSPFSAGDFIQFCPISVQEYKVIKDKIRNDRYSLKILHE